MELNKIMNERTSDYTLVTNVNNMQMSDYMKGYFNEPKYHELCKQCNKYGTLWSCPPYSFNVEDYIKKYKYVHLIGTKVLLSEKLIKETKPEDVIDSTYKIINSVRKKLRVVLLNLEKQYPGSVALYAGSCIICDKCTRPQNKPCVHPNTMRYSLESLGFDVFKTASELLDIEIKWAKEALPEYLTLVSAFFTNEDIKALGGFDFV